MAVQAYRIIQEAITNAVKHSDADLIKVRLSGHDESVTVEISDDGRGMPDDIVSTGLGMMTMRQRAEMIGADFELHSFAGNGTKVSCVLPLSK